MENEISKYRYEQKYGHENDVRFNILRDYEIIMNVNSMITASIIVNELNQCNEEAYHEGYIDGFLDCKSLQEDKK